MMMKEGKNITNLLLGFDCIFAFLSIIGCTLGILGLFVDRLKTISQHGLIGIFALASLGLLWSFANSLHKKIESPFFEKKGGFLNPAILLSLIEMVVMLLCIKAVLFYPSSCSLTCEDSKVCKFGFLGAIFMPYVFNECIRQLLGSGKSRKQDTVILGILILGCLVMAGLIGLDIKMKKNYTSIGIFSIGVLSLLVRLAFIGENENTESSDDSEDEGLKEDPKYIGMVTTLMLVTLIFARSHRILFSKDGTTLFDSLKSLNLLGLKAGSQAS
ncbi:hypothetical protein P7C65_08s1g12420 [Encephalitozoon intestinalis]